LPTKAVRGGGIPPAGQKPVVFSISLRDVHWTGDRNTIRFCSTGTVPEMNITLNGTNRSFERTMTVGDLLIELGATGKRVAVEVNEEIVPRSMHGQYELKNDDRVEVVQAIGGG